MPYRIQQILFRAAMGVMTGNAAVATRHNPLVGRSKPWCSLIMTTGAQLTDGADGHGGKIGTVGIMTGRAVLRRRLMQSTVAPVLGNLTVTTEAQGRLTTGQITVMGGTVTAVAGRTLTFSHRLMGKLDLADRGFHLAVAIHAHLSRPSLEQAGLVGAVGAMAEQTVPIGEGHMRIRPGLDRFQLAVTAEAHGSADGGIHQQSIMTAAMGGVTAGAVTLGEGAMLTEQPHFSTGLTMAG